jgi:hypothetical protein
MQNAGFHGASRALVFKLDKGIAVYGIHRE